VVVRDSRVAGEDRAHAAAGRVEQIRLITLDLPVLQQVEAEPVPVEAQAGLELADHHGMMSASGHSTCPPSPWPPDTGPAVTPPACWRGRPAARVSAASSAKSQSGSA